ncbi:hypothetical protein Vretimale_6807 [Volvox reticuliferus]|uniref:Uncharacterized protein n=1 Tax=Volvox reticuliferus TaxID=1737510 RepID=A0A8J4LM59_9CHLO|nr:hypothetical protein Vretifemale_7008 [Volvox reticuliferus]GIL77609.1 hypothetical protein Vretifemale_7008 [Volvox reticuliferus]GIL77612.1 hypothetical protein Vretifemale_7008 [Volvox reticuliferus]GIM02077.1 hypothetical protein Vretimale_6807 [Volvox reticuliferus]GIM02078.1 hypothetical protein Vretimale_6807 [Volvox reticuliferus]
MFSDYSSLLSQKRRCAYYVPWISLISLLIVLAGTIVWGVGTSNALERTNLMLENLEVDWYAEIGTAQTVASVAIAGCCVLAGGMLAMSTGRSCTEYAVDQKGAPTRGSRYWLVASAVATLVWWLLLVFLMFAFFVCVVWMGVTFAVTGLLYVAFETADDFVQWGIHYQNVTTQILEAQLGPLPDDIDSTSCPSNCLNLVIAEYITGNMVCICSSERLRIAYFHAVDALDATVAVVVGCFLVWVGASFILMNATADFAQSRRERALLLRVQRTLAAGGGAAGGDAFVGDFAAKTMSSSMARIIPEQQLQQQQQQSVEMAAGAGIGLASNAYGMQPPYGADGYTDVDNVPLLKEASRQQSYQERQVYQPQQEYQQPYQNAYAQAYGYLQQQPQQPTVVVATATGSDATPLNGGR